jgi:DHA3 family macrolide efflux protein-like MFS transporter
MDDNSKGNGSRRRCVGHRASWKRTFFTIWSGQVFSILGSSLAGFALVWWLASTSESATVLAGATLMMVLPQIVLGPLMGALVDRWNRRLVMVVVDTLIALLSLGLAYLFFSGQVAYRHVYLVMLIRAVGQVIHLLAMQAATPLMVPEKHLARVAGMNQTLSGVMNIVAPPMGALLLGILPIGGVLLIDVATALLAVLPLCFIQIPSPPRTRPVSEALAGKTSVWQDMREGLSFVWGWPGLTVIVVMAALLNLFGVPCLSFIPLLVTDHLKMGALGLGWLQTISAVGLLCGGLLLSAWGGFQSRIVTAFLALAMQGIGAMLMGIAPANAFVVALIGNLLWGFSRPIIDGLIFAILQSTVPPEVLGRVFSLMLSACAAMTPLGLLVAGPVVDTLGVQAWFVLTGTLTLFASALGFTIPAVRRLEDKQAGSLAASAN